jgi:adenylate kinase
MIVFLGLAGSGKTTQGQLLAKRLGCPWLSTGQLLRDNMKDQSVIKKMLEGEIISDDILLPILEEQMKTLHADHDEFILDGTPRTMVQAKWIVERVQHHAIKLTAIFQLNASEAVVKERLLHRGRPDDHEEAIAERFREYERNIVPILKFFRDEGYEVYEVDAERPEETIADDIEERLGLSQ